jgi:hypothetical protein
MVSTICLTQTCLINYLLSKKVTMQHLKFIPYKIKILKSRSTQKEKRKNHKIKIQHFGRTRSY